LTFLSESNAAAIVSALASPMSTVLPSTVIAMSSTSASS
jgi:hypothetical protein